jgi:hypothetical protein
MVLPVRIELTTSPFITLTLSRPPPGGVRALDHPFALGSREPLGAARLASTPSHSRAWLGIAVGEVRTVSPILGGALPVVSDRVGKLYQGSALPLSYGSSGRDDNSHARGRGTCHKAHDIATALWRARI